MRSCEIPCKMVTMIADLYEGFECAVIDENENLIGSKSKLV